MKKFKEMIFKDFGWKLLSIAIATILWFMVINIDQPVDTRTYSRPLSIENMSVLTDKGLTIGNLEELKTTKVNVKVKAQRTALDRLSQNPEWISAVADLSELTSVNNGDIISLPVAVSIQGGNTYGISSKSPAAVEIHIEIMDSRELPVEVKLNGTLEDGTYLSEPLLSAETVRVTGPASLVNTIVSVRFSLIPNALSAPGIFTPSRSVAVPAHKTSSPSKICILRMSASPPDTLLKYIL
jgi:YbbR domain-containing protein